MPLGERSGPLTSAHRGDAPRRAILLHGPDSPTGRGVRLKPDPVWVRIPLGAPCLTCGNVPALRTRGATERAAPRSTHVGRLTSSLAPLPRTVRRMYFERYLVAARPCRAAPVDRCGSAPCDRATAHRQHRRAAEIANAVRRVRPPRVRSPAHASWCAAICTCRDARESSRPTRSRMGSVAHERPGTSPSRHRGWDAFARTRADRGPATRQPADDGSTATRDRRTPAPRVRHRDRPHPRRSYAWHRPCALTTRA